MSPSSQPQNLEIHIEIKDIALVAIDQIAAVTDLSKQRIKYAMKKGAVWLTHAGEQEGHTQRLRRAKKQLNPGDTLHLYYDEAILAVEPPAATLIADEGDYSIWYKPYGMLSQGSKWSDHCTINRWAEQHLLPERPAFLVHRLDRAASGLILVAHKKSSAAALAALFEKRQIDKRYRVIVHGKFGLYRRTLNSEIDGRAATSHASLLHYDREQNRSLLEVKIESGRKHQIRRHLAEIDYPVVGDRLYGNEGDSEDLQLVAYRLSFIDPATKEERDYQLPDELMEKFLTAE
jgi:tRNA pseudouridine32 synthase/23S rRNA pseudouridine746 synthase